MAAANGLLIWSFSRVFFSFGSSWLQCHGSPAPVFVFIVHTNKHILVVCHCLIKNTVLKTFICISHPYTDVSITVTGVTSVLL